MLMLIVFALFSISQQISKIKIESNKYNSSEPSQLFFSRPQSRKNNDCNIPPNPFKRSTFRNPKNRYSTSKDTHDFIMEQLIHENKLHRKTNSFLIKNKKLPNIFEIIPEPTPKISFIESVVASYPNVHPQDVEILAHSNPFDVAENLKQVFLILKILDFRFHSKCKTILSRAVVTPTSGTARIDKILKTPLKIPKQKVKTAETLFLSLHTIVVILNSLHTFEPILPKIKTIKSESIDSNLLLINRFIKELNNMKKAFKNLSEVKNINGHNFSHVSKYLGSVIEQISNASYNTTFSLVSNVQSGMEYARMLLKTKLEIILKVNRNGYIWRAAKILLSVFKDNQTLENKIDLDMNILKINNDKERFRKCNVFLGTPSYKEGRKFIKTIDYLISTLPTKNINEYYQNPASDETKKRLNKLYESQYQTNEHRYFKYIGVFEIYRNNINKLHFDVLEASKSWENIKLLLGMFEILKTEETFNRDMKFSTPKQNKNFAVKVNRADGK